MSVFRDGLIYCSVAKDDKDDQSMGTIIIIIPKYWVDIYNLKKVTTKAKCPHHYFGLPRPRASADEFR